MICITKEMIDSFVGKNDCFKEAAFMIKNECSQLDDISIDEKSICKFPKYSINLYL